MLRSAVIFAVLFFSAFSTPAVGQIVGSGATQIDIGGNLTFVRPTDTRSGGARGTVRAALTRFATDQFEWGAATSLRFDSDGNLNGSMGGLGQWNFTNQSLWLPFVGVTAGTAWDGGDIADGLWGSVRAGLRRFIGETVSFNVTTAQSWAWIDGEFSWSEFEVFPLQFGFSVFLG